MFVDDHPDATLDEILAHHGVKGMHWGVRRGSSSGRSSGGRSVGQRVHDFNNKPDAGGVSRKQARVAIRGQQREMYRKAEDFGNSPRAKRDAEIQKARENLVKSTRQFEDKKREIKAKRAEIGKHAARIALNDARTKHALVVTKANTETGREHTMRVLSAVGNHVLNNLAENSARRAAAPGPSQPFRTASQRV